MEKKSIKMTAEEIRKRIEKWRERDSEMVSGIFKNLECPGQSVSFNFKAYKGEPFRDWCFQDGERYTIPRGIAVHLNTNCYYKEYQHIAGDFGGERVQAAYNDGRLKSANTMTVARKINRFAFHSLEFTKDDLDMVPSTLLEVTHEAPTVLKPS